jgi:hypothetical protein
MLGIQTEDENMTRITLDPNLRIQLPDVSQPFAVCDEAGKLVGSYIPASAGPPISRDEIERRKQNKGKGYTTSEVLAHLEKL